jgi:hypothetical protein
MPDQLPHIDTVHLLPEMDKLLLQCLTSLSADQWHLQTIAKKWKVKDVVAHLLDGNIRILSMLRDQYSGEFFTGTSYDELLQFLNGLNADWVKAMRRVSPGMLILLHQCTGKLYCDYYASLDPNGKAGFAVSWAGETESKNWMHIAREYTEKWLHQQQIRYAIGDTTLLQHQYYHPFLQTCFLALPYTFRNTDAPDKCIVTVKITGEAGGCWSIIKQPKGWQLIQAQLENPSATVIIPQEFAWPLFSKSLRPEMVMDKITIQGNHGLAETALGMVSFMA